MRKAHNSSEKAYIEVLHGDKGEPNIVKKIRKIIGSLETIIAGKFLLTFAWIQFLNEETKLTITTNNKSILNFSFLFVKLIEILRL